MVLSNLDSFESMSSFFVKKKIAKEQTKKWGKINQSVPLCYSYLHVSPLFRPNSDESLYSKNFTKNYL